MSQCKVYLENYSGVYYAGSEIRGKVECYFNDEVTARGIKIRIKCKEHNSWSGTETYTDSQHKTHTRHITLNGDNTVLYSEQMLFGSDSGGRELSRGRHVYPFVYTLPRDIPSTFNGPHGSILYKVKAIVDRPMRTDYEDEFIFMVQSPIDFNHMPRDLQDITTYSDEKTVCCWCCAGGNITMDVELPKIAFVPGETIPFQVKMTNLSNSNVENLKVKLTKTVSYKVTNPRVETKEDVDNIVSFTEHGVGAHGEYTYNLSLAIPGHIEVPNFTKCDLFRVSYELKVSAEMPSCTMDLDVAAWDIKLGHVQCTNYDEEQNNGKVHTPPPAYPTSPGMFPIPAGGTYPPPAEGAYPPPAGGTYPPPTGGYPPPVGGAYPPPVGGAYPPPAGGAYPPLAGGSYPPPAGGSYPPPAGGYGAPPFPAKAPSAPDSSIASAPADDNSKAREAAASGPGFVSEPPPPTYNQAQQNFPYPPQ